MRKLWGWASSWLQTWHIWWFEIDAEDRAFLRSQRGKPYDPADWVEVERPS